MREGMLLTSSLRDASTRRARLGHAVRDARRGEKRGAPGARRTRCGVGVRALRQKSPSSPVRYSIATSSAARSGARASSPGATWRSVERGHAETKNVSRRARFARANQANHLQFQRRDPPLGRTRHVCTDVTGALERAQTARRSRARKQHGVSFARAARRPRARSQRRPPTTSARPHQ